MAYLAHGNESRLKWHYSSTAVLVNEILCKYFVEQDEVLRRAWGA